MNLRNSFEGGAIVHPESLVLADSVAKVPKCIRLIFPPNDKTSRNRRLI
jgi:hypothetical protein